MEKLKVDVNAGTCRFDMGHCHIHYTLSNSCTINFVQGQIEISKDNKITVHQLENFVNLSFVVGDYLVIKGNFCIIIKHNDDLKPTHVYVVMTHSKLNSENIDSFIDDKYEGERYIFDNSHTYKNGNNRVNLFLHLRETIRKNKIENDLRILYNI